MYFCCSRFVPEVVDNIHLAGMRSLLAAQPSRPPTETAPSQTLKPGSGWKINLFHKCFYRFNPPCPLMLDEVEDARNAILVAHIVLLYTFVALKMRIVSCFKIMFLTMVFEKQVGVCHCLPGFGRDRRRHQKPGYGPPSHPLLLDHLLFFPCSGLKKFSFETWALKGFIRQRQASTPASTGCRTSI